MGLRARFSVTGDLGYPESTPELGLPIDYSDGCQAFADAWLDAATDMVPVDTGYLQSTLESYADSDGCTCETDCDYAEYVEYGTIKMGAQPYFEPAIEIARAEAEPLWMEAYQDALREEQAELEALEESSGHTEGGNRWRANEFIQQQVGIGGGGFGSLGGLILGAIIVGFFNVLMDIASGGSGSSSGYSGGMDGAAGGGGSIDVEII